MESPSGRARVYLRAADRRGLGLLLGHGARVVGWRRLTWWRLREAALAEGVSVGLVEQPYRVAGATFAGRWQASLTEPGWRWFPASASASLRGFRCWLAAALRVRGSPAAPPPHRCGRGRLFGFPVAAASPLRAAPRRAVLRNWTRLRSRPSVVQGTRDQFGIPPANRQRTVVGAPATTASGGICRQWLPAVQPWLADSSADSASGRGGDRARAVPCRPPPEPSLGPAASAPSVASPAAPPLPRPQRPSLPPAVGPVRHGHLAQLGWVEAPRFRRRGSCSGGSLGRLGFGMGEQGAEPGWLRFAHEPRSRVGRGCGVVIDGGGLQGCPDRLAAKANQLLERIPLGAGGRATSALAGELRVAQAGRSCKKRVDLGTVFPDAVGSPRRQQQSACAALSLCLPALARRPFAAHARPGCVPP